MATRRNVNVADETERSVRQARFWRSVEAIWERNKDLSAAEAQALADKAVAEVRANREPAMGIGG